MIKSTSSPHGTPPSEVAQPYRVETADDGKLQLVADGRTTLVLSPCGTFLTITAAPSMVNWSHGHDMSARELIHLKVTDLAIGHRGDEGWSSSLADNCFFAIDNDTIHYLPLDSIRVMPREDLLRETRSIQLNSMRPRVDPIESESGFIATITPSIFQLAKYGPPQETLFLSIGVDATHFARIREGALSGHLFSVCFNGYCTGLTSSFQYGSARDLVLIANESAPLSIDTMSVHYWLEPRTNPATETEQQPTVAPIATPLMGEMDRAIRALSDSLEKLHSTVTKFAWFFVVAVLVAMFLHK